MRSTAASTSATGTTDSVSWDGSGSHTPIVNTCPSEMRQPISAVASRLLDPSKKAAISSPSATTCVGSASALHACGVVHASSAAVGQFKYLRLESSGLERGSQIRSMMGLVFCQKQSSYTNSSAARSDSGSVMSEIGRAHV